MPAEFALLPIIESGYNPFAHSGAGASGLWQIITALLLRRDFPTKELRLLSFSQRDNGCISGESWHGSLSYKAINDSNNQNPLLCYGGH